MSDWLEEIEDYKERLKALFVAWGVCSVALFWIGAYPVEGVFYITDVRPIPMIFVYLLLPVVLSAPKYIALGLVSLPLYHNNVAVARAFLATLILLVAIDVAVIVEHFLTTDYDQLRQYWSSVLLLMPATVIVFFVAYTAFNWLTTFKR